MAIFSRKKKQKQELFSPDPAPIERSEMADFTSKKIEKKRRSEPNRVRNNSLRLRLSEDELALINERAAAAGVSRAEYIMRCVNGTPAVYLDGAKELLHELKKQGVNLNQAAKIANELHDTRNLQALKIAISENQNARKMFVDFLEKWEIRLAKINGSEVVQDGHQQDREQ